MYTIENDFMVLHGIKTRDSSEAIELSGRQLVGPGLKKNTEATIWFMAILVMRR